MESALGICQTNGITTMGINVSTSMGFENRQFLQNAAKEILQKNGAESDKALEIVQKAVFAGSDFVSSTELNTLKVSTQITLNNSLKETLKYLKAHANDKRKKYVLGELWEQIDENTDNYNGELVDFEVDTNLKNIFAA